MEAIFRKSILVAGTLAVMPLKALDTSSSCEKIPEALGLTAETWCLRHGGRFDHGNCLQMKDMDMRDPRARALGSYLSSLWDNGCESEAIGTKNSIGLPIAPGCTNKKCLESAKAYYREEKPR